MKKGISKNKKRFPSIVWMIGMLMIIVAPWQTSYAQKIKSQNESLLKIAESSMELGLVHLKKELRINPITIFTEHKAAFGINRDCEMHIKKISPDLIGNKHYRYQQYYKNILVEGGEYIVHEKDGIAVSVNGEIAGELAVITTPVITDQQALTVALNYLKADEYYWQNEIREKYLKAETKNSEATYFPKAELVFARIDLHDNGEAKHILAYKFIIYISKPSNDTRAIYVDALNGSIVKNLDLVITECSPTNIHTNFNGNQNICTYTDFLMSGFDMEDNTSPTVIKVFNYNDYNIYHDQDNIWTTPDELSAGSSLWAVKKSLDIYGVQFNRDGYDNDGSNINIIQNYNFGKSGGNNAEFYAPFYLNPAEIHVGFGDSVNNVLDDFNTLDIMGHEFSHGVSNSVTNWITNYSGETGALNEAFSDIMGETIEWYVTGTTDWLHGAQRIGGPGRSLIDPKDKFCPDTYHGAFWEKTADDNYGVHRNSGPMSYVFYLISQGGGGWNVVDSTTKVFTGNGCYYYISGIGIAEASRIFYQALNYLGDDSKYIRAHDYTIQAAIDLYGPCSKEAIQIAEAWRAVGIGSGSPCYDNNPVCNSNLSLPYYRSNSTFLVGGGTCIVNVVSDNPVAVSASDYVLFRPGFTAGTGTDFRAYIDACVINAP
jgi:bacillolysin